MKSAIVSFIAIISICVQVRADEISLPLGGYYHPGRAMPISWTASTASIQFFASDAVTTQLDCANTPRGIVPFLILDPKASQISWRSSAASGQVPVHPLDGSDCLIVDTLAKSPDVIALFPNLRTVKVYVDPANLLGPAMAWESVDAILVSPVQWQKWTWNFRRQLFSQGITLIVAGGSRPDPLFPWHRENPWWTASPNLKLPPVISPDAYAPVDGPSPGRSADFRRRIFLLGVIYCLLAGGFLLLRSRCTPVAFVIVSILAAVVFALDNSRQSPISERSGIIRLASEPPIEDHWFYQVSHRPTDFELPIDGLVHPIFLDESQIQSANLTLKCNADGRPVEIDGHLRPDDPVALMTRRFASDLGVRAISTFEGNPLRLLGTQSLYPGFSIQGHLSEQTAEDAWPTLVLTRQ